MPRVLALFPGQGSQKVGMGVDLYERFELARDLFAKADAALGFPLSEICFQGPADKLTMTAIAQPAILTVSVITYELAKLAMGDKLEVCAAAGHSLGEYSAYVASGALRFEDAVKLVNKRGTYMQDAVPLGVGKMIAVLGKDLPEIESALSKVTVGVAQVANVNSPGQVVIAGDVKGVDEFCTALGAAKIAELAVSAPFHSSLMKPAEEKLRVDLGSVELKEPSFPVYGNFRAAPSPDTDGIRETLAQQVCGRVRWVECMQNAVRDTKPEFAYEFGTGNVLTGLLKRIDPAVARENFGSVESIEALS